MCSDLVSFLAVAITCFLYLSLLLILNVWEGMCSLDNIKAIGSMQEKELKRLNDEAEKDERRREKEESEMRKQLKRQQEEAEKEQRRKEKEEAEKRKQLALQKQASIMERFLKKSKDKSTCKNDQCSPKEMTPDAHADKRRDLPEPVTQLMDSTLLRKDGINTGDLRK